MIGGWILEFTSVVADARSSVPSCALHRPLRYLNLWISIFPLR